MANEIITTLHPDQDPSIDLYPNIKKENIPNGSVDVSKLDPNYINSINNRFNDVNDRIDDLSDGSPRYVNTSTNILALTSNQGLAVGTDSGHWYYWDGSQYVDGGVYQATQIGVGSVTRDNLSDDLNDRIDNKIDIKLGCPLEYSGYLHNDGSIYGDGFHCLITDKIPCKEGDVFYYKGVGVGSAVNWIMYTDNTIVSVSALTFNDYHKVIIPQNINYIKFSSFATNGSEIPFGLYSDNYMSQYNILDNKAKIDDLINIYKPFKNQYCKAFGDSITNGATYFDSMKSTCEFLDIDNYGVSGSSIAKFTDESVPSFAERVDTLDITYTAIVTILGGTNDYGNDIPLGDITSSDITTFYGALNHIFYTLQTRNQYTRIVIMTPTQRGDMLGSNNVGLTLKDYANAIKNIAELYGVPCLDLYGQSGLTPNNTSAFTTDGLHWNYNFGNKTGKMIGKFINSLSCFFD